MLGLGGLIIIVSLIIELLTGWIDKRFGRDDCRLEWAMNDTLQLQRLAHEELGCGTWVGNDFPITAFGERLAVLDISDPSHPKLVNPATAMAANDANDTSNMSDTTDVNDASDATNATATTATTGATGATATPAADAVHAANTAIAANKTDDAALSPKNSHIAAEV